MKGYFAYIRVSTVRQGEQSSSLQEQRAAIEAHAVRNNLAIAEWFEERETAAKHGRTQFNAMMSRLRNRQAIGIIIHKIDRSARNLRDWARLGELIDMGIDVRFAHESLDLGSRGGRLAADIQAVVAADYIRNLRDEVRKGFNGRLNQGLYPLPAPIGYLDMGGGKRKEIDPIAGPLVRMAFQLYGSGRFTVDELRAEMERRGLRNRRGSAQTRNSVWAMLRNPFYMGLIHVGRTKHTFAGAHEPLVRKVLFDRVQTILSGRSYVGATKHGFVFSRLIKCSACGRSLVGERQKGHTYYRCHTPACRGTSVREANVHDELAQVFSLIVLDEQEFGDLRDFREVAQADNALERNAAIAQAKLGLGRCDDFLGRLTDAYLEGALERELFEQRKAKLLSDRRGYLDTINMPPDRGNTLKLIEKLELGNMALQQAEFRNDEKIRETVSLVVSNLVAVGKKLVITPRFPFDELLKARSLTNGGPYRAQPRTRAKLCPRVEQNESAALRHQNHTLPRRRAKLNVSRLIAEWEKSMDDYREEQ